MPDAPTPDQGWYPDPAGGDNLRWWDGNAWTHQVKKAPEPPPPPAPPPASQQPTVTVPTTTPSTASAAGSPSAGSGASRNDWWKWAVAGVVGIVIGAAAAGGASEKTKTVTNTETSTVTTQDTTAVEEAQAELSDLKEQTSTERRRLRRLKKKVTGARATVAKNSFEGDGTYVVGSDISAGVYRASASPGCYWARLSSLDTSDIIDNDNADGPVVIEVLPTDKAVTVTRCATFRKAS